jgi:formylglycine-generating enzyme required for sulfatase activity
MSLTRTTAIAVVLAVASATALASAPRRVSVPEGTYRPLYRAPQRAGAKVTGRDAGPQRHVPSFEMDVYPVTNAEFLAFVRDHPEWQRSRVSRLFADASYLRHWQGDLELGPDAPPSSPVVYVSWFAARAYLKDVGEQLPTVDQWEYVGAASATARDASRTPAFLDRVRDWYGRPTPDRLPAVGSTFRNVYGVRDMHGLVWEWTLDFNSSLVTGESRADGSLERSLYCGSEAAGASDFEDYAAFMRYAFRSSLEARYTVSNLGFRGVLATTRPAR